MDINSIIYYVIGLLATISLLILGHYLNWKHLINRELARYEAYVYGSASLWVGFTVTSLLMGDINAVWRLTIFYVTGGLLVGILHLIRDMGEQKARSRRQQHAAEREKALNGSRSQQ
jgi:hypothetical protein